MESKFDSFDLGNFIFFQVRREECDAVDCVLAYKNIGGENTFDHKTVDGNILGLNSDILITVIFYIDNYTRTKDGIIFG